MQLSEDLYVVPMASYSSNWRSLAVEKVHNQPG